MDWNSPSTRRAQVALVGISDAARELNVSSDTVRRWLDRGLLHGVRLPSGFRKVDRADLERIRDRMLAPLTEEQP